MASMAGEGKRVVVIGGGSGGSLAAKLLQDHADVVLIDTKEYFEITWANLRSMVEPSFAGRCIINHSEYLPDARVIVSAATDINGDEVVTAAGHRIPYDYLIIATGHLDPCALTRGERLNYFQSEYEKIISSNSILIVGGGPTGVELAGEIAVDFPEKKVTLVHRGMRLMEFIGPKASRKTLDWLTTKRVEVILGQSVNPTPVSEGVYETSGGETIRADCMFTCIGKPVGSSWLQSTMFKSSLDTKGRLMVEPNLRVKGYNNVFAIGDITDIPEIKQGYLANAHAELTAKNLKLLMAGGPESKMGIHKPGKALAFVSLGRNDAVAQILFITMIGCVPGKIKSKDLFVGKTRKQLGLKP